MNQKVKQTLSNRILFGGLEVGWKSVFVLPLKILSQSQHDN